MPITNNAVLIFVSVLQHRLLKTKIKKSTKVDYGFAHVDLSDV
ncbi:hypothetical protein [Staphylococcus xylosus]|nr:hypothetical protein [Staphylococcus xylosus]